MKCRESRKDFLDRKRAERLKDPNREKKARRTREAVGAITKRFADLLKDQEPITLKSTLIDFKNDMKLKIPKVTK